MIEETEALSVIDVNSASYLGDTDDQKAYFKVNLEAVDTAVKQICLRNLSGIIIIDFIDMADAASEVKVLRRLKEAFCQRSSSADHFRFYCIGISANSAQAHRSKFKPNTLCTLQ